MATKAYIKGLDKLVKDLKSLGKEGVQVIADVTHGTAQAIATQASVNAPVNYGDLHQSIREIEVDKLNWKIVANATGLAPYAAYVEFGTGTKVKVPAELKDVAERFRGGTGGSFEDGLEAIEEWCKRKGLPKEAAYPIFMSILRYGIEAQPYLYPAFVEGRTRYLKDLKEELETLTKKI